MLLYDSGEFKLSEAKELPTEKRKEIAQKDYKHWFGKGASFFIDTFHALERKDFNKGAFELHQATESFYSTILLVFTGYKPKLHDILQLSQMTRSYNHELFKIFPCEGNVSRADGNSCGLLKAALKDKKKNPSGHHRCWVNINEPSDELWKISKELFL